MSKPKAVRFGKSDKEVVGAFCHSLFQELEKEYGGNLPNGLFERLLTGGVPIKHIAQLVRAELDACANPRREIPDPDAKNFP